MITDAIGPPGVYYEPAAATFSLTGVRMDVCAFAGVAVRGPARVPVAHDEYSRGLSLVDRLRPRRRSVAVPVESFQDYRRLFGGFEGPGLLPYAVQAFFEQGGVRAYIVRIVHDYGRGAAANFEAVAHGILPGIQRAAGGSVELLARSEGRWGNGLRARIEYSTRPVMFDALRSSATELAFPPAAGVPAGTTLRLETAPGVRHLTIVGSGALVPRLDSPRREWRVTLAPAVPAVPTSAEVVEATLVIEDGAGNREVHANLALSAIHARFLGRVLCEESALVWPADAWAESDLMPPDVRLTALPAPDGQFSDGADRFEAIVPEDFFDSAWRPEAGEAGDGVCAIANVSDVAMLCAPDLYSPQALVPVEPIEDPASLAGPRFSRCVSVPPRRQATAAGTLTGLRRDPLMPEELKDIVARQAQLVEFAERLRRITVLLDVPPGLQLPQIIRWRRALSSAYAAAYHPWLGVAPADDDRDTLVRTPPSAAAAGIVAARERAFGVPFGPANTIARGVVMLDRELRRDEHTALFEAGINVYAREPGGFALTSARTLSDAPEWRQLSVRRLVTQLALTLERQMQWVVFENHTPALRRELRRAIRALLRGLFLRNAFAGQTEEEAYFVRCDEALNDARTIDAGQLIAEVGVAPAEPLEFLVVRLVRDLDGRLTVEG
jgi:hypothetical protein